MTVRKFCRFTPRTPSQKNINSLISAKHKFTIAVPLNNKWVQQAIDDVYQDIHSPQGYQRQECRYTRYTFRPS
jgi:hypothetical protein